MELSKVGTFFYPLCNGGVVVVATETEEFSKKESADRKSVV